MQLDKNGKLPETYRNFPYQYTHLNFGVLLRKNSDEIFLQGDDETQFFCECNRAKQKGRGLADVIEEYLSTNHKPAPAPRRGINIGGLYVRTSI